MSFPLTIPLTLVIIKDEETGRYASYFEELPNIHASGETEEQAALSLAETVKAVFLFKQKESEKILSQKRHIAKRENYQLALA